MEFKRVKSSRIFIYVESAKQIISVKLVWFKMRLMNGVIKMIKEVFSGNMYIFIPFYIDKRTIFNKSFGSLKNKKDSDLIAKKYIDDFIERSDDEITDGVHSSLERRFLGSYDLKTFENNESSNDFKEDERYKESLVFLTLHEKTQLVIVTVVLKGEEIPASQLLDIISQDHISIVKDEKDTLFSSFLNQELGIIQASTARVCLSTKNKIDTNILPYYFANETYMSSSMSTKLKSEIFQKQSEINIAEYESSELYVGKNSVLRIDKRTKNKDEKYPEIYSDIAFLFIMETLAFKDGAICRTNKKVLKAIEQSNNIELDSMDALTSEFTKTMPFWDIHIFKYISAQNLANKIESSFEINKSFDNYFKNQEFLQYKVNVKQGINQQKESKILYYIAIILFVFSSVDFLNKFYSKLFDNKSQIVDDLLSTGLSVSSTGFIFIIIILILRYKKSKNRVLNG